MPNVKQQSLVRVHMALPGPLVAGWKAQAQARGMTMTAFQTLVMTQILAGEDAEAGLPARTLQAKKQALTLRLRPDEIQGIRQAAKTEGHSLAGWVAMLIRARLRQAPSFTGQEVAALLKASTQLMAIGRNINTAVRRLHADGKWTSHNQPMLAALEAVKALELHINALQAAAERRSNF